MQKQKKDRIIEQRFREGEVTAHNSNSYVYKKSKYPGKNDTPQIFASYCKDTH